MFRIDSAANEITPLDKVTFSSLNFRERDHLQEWIAKYPIALGEDLLIIQKEYCGFDETMERLDLLALNKKGELVVIENKLDDSGRDVVWQGLKYAGYCANLSSQQLVDIFEEYLAKQPQQPKERARDIIADFIDKDDREDNDLDLNKNQHVIFVAAKFRKEVTNTVLWLAQYGVSCKCIKVTPYVFGTEQFLNVEQVIPTPESEDYMIGLQKKKAEVQQESSSKIKRHNLNKEFWTQALSALQSGHCKIFDRCNPTTASWAEAVTKILPSVSYVMVWGQHFVRVEIKIKPSNPNSTLIFETLQKEQLTLAESFGAPFSWDTTDGGVHYIRYQQAVEGNEKEHWPVRNDWFLEHITKLKSTFVPHLTKLKKQLG